MQHGAALVCVLVLASSPAHAQGLSFGAKAGVAVADLHFGGEGGEVNTDPRIGLVAGGFVNRSLFGRFEIQPEVLYAQKGTTVDEGGARLHIELDFVDVPVLIRYPLTGPAHTRAFVFAGPSVSFRLRARLKTTFSGEENEQDIKDDIEPVEFGVVFGGGMGFGRIHIDGRYDWGITDVESDSSDDASVKHRVWMVLTGYRF
jgi:outer membrane protein with beta-barrel domain